MKGSENMQEAEIEMVGFDNAGHLDQDDHLDDTGHLDDDVQEKTGMHFVWISRYLDDIKGNKGDI